MQFKSLQPAQVYGAWVIETEQQEHIAIIPKVGRDDPEAEQYAHLLASAPKMLKALEGFIIKLMEVEYSAKELGGTEWETLVGHIDWLDDQLSEEVIQMRNAIALVRQPNTERN